MYRPLIIGETCLLRYQLSRLKIKNDQTNLFDDMKINLDSVSGVIMDNFADILNPDYLQRVNYLYYPDHNIWHNKFLNLKYSIDLDNLFSWKVCCFFHFDIYNQEELSSLVRKRDRTKILVESEDAVTLFYYYRNSEKQNIKKLKLKLYNFIKFLQSKYDKEFNCILITQDVGNLENINVSEDSNVSHVHFTTLNSWVGIDDNWDGHKENHMFDTFFSKFTT